MIKDHTKLYRFCQPLGKVSNNYGELFAICKSMILLEEFFPIDITNRRIIIMTDSQCSFAPLITTPRKKLKYSHLYQRTQKHIKKLNIILWKIKSHTKPVIQFFNWHADRLADVGRTNTANSIFLHQSDQSFKFAKYDSIPCPFGANIQNIVRDHCVRTVTALQGNGPVVAPD